VEAINPSFMAADSAQKWGREEGQSWNSKESH
jgi:hypothetical protein